ncbi:hypothetical protein PG997_008747 [Apiospora hydei]|uniref:Uncharacterized protein n=1 Tax=Apiospora hydei TaxID=1337664 RepID=A0ABR1WFI8_9PEZI
MASGRGHLKNHSLNTAINRKRILVCAAALLFILSMSIFSTGNEARLGALNIIPVFNLPPLPNIVSEWAAIIPLVSHLATHRDDYITTGEVALLGRVSTGLFPRLGTLSGLSRLLRRGPEFVDQASTKGGSSMTVWDVRWGSVFPAANGAASKAITKYVLNRGKESVIAMPNNSTMPNPKGTKSTNTPDLQTKASTEPRGKFLGPLKLPTFGRQPSIVSRQFRRSQVLHVLRFERGPKVNSWRLFLERLRLTLLYRIFVFLALLGVVSTLFVCGTYGTATVLLACAVSRLLCPSVQFKRTSEYLMNNENHDACMLLASHQNALEWHLYIGDRSVVDTLLNKPMIHIVAGYLRGTKVGMGFFLVILLAIDLYVRWHFRGKSLARDWLDREGISVDLKTFEFEGRETLIGSIQVWSQTEITRWMDDILVPHPRRDAWLESLANRVQGDRNNTNMRKLAASDEEWVQRATDLSIACGKILDTELNAKVV